MVARRSILFLGHAATRNGASLLLLSTLRWLRAHTDFALEVVCAGSGPLIAEYRQVAPTHAWPARLLPRADAGPIAAGLLQAAGQAARLFHGRRRHDLVYANTAAAWPLVEMLGGAGNALLWHIHELPYALELSMPSARERALLGRATRVVAVSGAVEQALAAGCWAARERIEVVHGFVPAAGLAPDERQARRTALLARLGWPEDAFVIGACGVPGWRKGSDLFLLAARQAMDLGAGRPLRFLWLGGAAAQSPEGLQFDHDARALGLAAHCARVPATDDVDSGYAAMDAFALTSREDPFPLVVLEAAMHGVPTLCFEGAGGSPEFVREIGRAHV